MQLIALLVMALTPDWVRHGGVSPRFPTGSHLLGFAVVEKPDQLDQAKQAAAADLASRITVRIENQMSDVNEEKDGKQSYAVATMTKASTDVRLSGLSYETHVADGKTYALAILDRQAAAGEYRTQRNLAIQRAEQNVQQATLKSFFAARVALGEAMERDAITRVIQNGQDDKAFMQNVSTLTTKAEVGINALLKKPVATFSDLTEALALQLSQQTVGKTDRVTIAAPTYGTTTFSSAFGRQLALDLERSLLSQAGGSGRELVMRGTYLTEGDQVRVLTMVRDAKTGTGVASAEAAVPKKALGPELAILPQNFQQAMLDQKMLGKGEEVSGNLRVELFTNKGRSNLIFANNEDLKISVRVNKPAYVQIIYMLAQNGMKVPLDQGYFIDESKVNRLVELPQTFSISPPFGVERVMAIAYTEKPEALITTKVKVDGEDYDVVSDAPKQLFKQRGAKAKKANKEVSEDWITLTTTAK